MRADISPTHTLCRSPVITNDGDAAFPIPPPSPSAPPGKSPAPDRYRFPPRPVPAGCSCHRGPVAPDRASPGLAGLARHSAGRGWRVGRGGRPSPGVRWRSGASTPGSPGSARREGRRPTPHPSRAAPGEPGGCPGRPPASRRANHASFAWSGSLVSSAWWPVRRI